MEMLGILGGMGPLASTAFLSSLYECGAPGADQTRPACVLLSDPRIADRSELLASHGAARLGARVAEDLERLVTMNATQLVVCCVTAHAVFPLLPETLRSKLVSLVSLALDEVSRCDGEATHVVVCTRGARITQVFEAEPAWRQLGGRVQLLDDADQRQAHDQISLLKRTGDPSQMLQWLQRIGESYATRRFVAGCTELHLVTRSLRHEARGDPDVELVDPLQVLAESFAGCRPAVPVRAWGERATA